MKIGNVIAAFLFAALCFIGWYSFGSHMISEADEYAGYIAQGDAWVEKGLYQRAIRQYEQALRTDPSEELYEKIHAAYVLRYAEAANETLDDFLDFLDDAVAAYPGNKVLVDSYSELNYAEENYSDVYRCLKNAIAHGYDTKQIQSALRDVRYTYSLGRSNYYEVHQSESEMYSVFSKNGRNVYGIASGNLLSNSYEYVGLPNENGVVVVTGADSRLVDADGLVLGIFEDPVTNAGVFAEGLVAVSFGGDYFYCDEFAEIQFGGYEVASMFQNGVAAVKDQGEWMLVDTDGIVVVKGLGDIVLDFAGRYCVNDIILAKTSAGSYSLYNCEYEEITTFFCLDMDICTKDALIAACQNGEWGFVDTSGRLVIDYQYDSAKSFSNGLAAVCKDGLWGFIDCENNLVIDYQFYDTGYMGESGNCAVCVSIPEHSSETDRVEQHETWKFLKLKLGIVSEE